MAFAAQQAPKPVQEAKAKAFWVAVEGMPLAAIKMACQKWIRGECGNSDHGFAPAPPQFLAAVKQSRDEAMACASALEEISRIEIIDESFNENSQKAEEMRIRIGGMMQDLAKGMKTKPEDPVLDDDGLEELKRKTIESLQEYQAAEETVKAVKGRDK